jgi:hypothetical protein
MRHALRLDRVRHSVWLEGVRHPLGLDGMRHSLGLGAFPGLVPVTGILAVRWLVLGLALASVQPVKFVDFVGYGGIPHVRLSFS